MEEKSVNSKDRLLELLLAFFSIGAMVVASVLYGLLLIDIIRNTIVICILVIALIVAIELDRNAGRMLFQNGDSLFRFFVSYMIFLVLACVYGLLPNTGWVFLPIFVTLTLFSGVSTGFLAGITLLCFPVLLTLGTHSGMLFLEYGVSGLVGALLFATIDEEFRIFKQFFISVIFQFLTLCVFNVLTVNKPFSLNLFFIPLINLLVSIIIILFVLRIFSFSFIYQARDRFMDIIDPEFELLVKLKECSKDDYEHSVYTAVLCSKLSVLLKLDEPLMKACGFYHRIGILRGSNTYENTDILLREYDIPEGVNSVLKEYLDSGTPVKQRETVVLIFADSVISSIRYLFKENPNRTIDYDKLIETIFEKKLSGGHINSSRITFEDMDIMKKALIGEKLFYDFLK